VVVALVVTVRVGVRLRIVATMDGDVVGGSGGDDGGDGEGEGDGDGDRVGGERVVLAEANSLTNNLLPAGNGIGVDINCGEMVIARHRAPGG